MFAGSVALYVTVRRSTQSGVPQAQTNLAMFAVPLLVYLAMATVQSTPMQISWRHAVIIIGAAFFFAYLGNVASLRSIGAAPNAGYSLVLSKSYVLFTTVIAVVFLDADLSPRRLAAIVAIVGFAALIMVNRSGAKYFDGRHWIWTAMYAFFAWGLLSLSSKYLFARSVPTLTFLVYLYMLVTLCILLFDRRRLRLDMNSVARFAPLLLATGVFSAFFNLGQFEAIRLAPNVGYVNAINAASIAVVTLLSALFFHDDLTCSKLVGVIGVIAGLLVLVV